MKIFRSLIFSGSVLFFTYLMWEIIAPYTSGSLDIDFLLTKQRIIHLWHYRFAFYCHIFSSLVVLAAGITQFSRNFLINLPQIHRFIGKVYVLFILFIAAPSGFVMGFYGNGNDMTKLSFILLAVLWWFSTWKSYQLIRQKNIQAHGAWMMRSYALTLSAITLRMMQFFISQYNYDIAPEDIYNIIAYPSWMLNALIAELIIRKTNWFSMIYK